MNEKSLIEIAIEWVQSNNNKDKHYTLKDIAKKTFEKKGLKISENADEYAQFQMDFMLCGNFTSYGEDKEGNKLWDLKYRLKHDVIDKESNEYYDVDDEDDEVKKNELSTNIDDFVENEEYHEESAYDKESEEDEEEEKEEMDDIEQELILRGSPEENEGIDDVEEDSYDDEDK